MDDALLSALALLAFVVLAFVVYAVQTSRLEDPSNKSVIHADQINAEHQLRPGPVQAALLRQSGAVYRDLGVFPDAEAALASVQASFRRAGIDGVAVMRNTPERLEVMRMLRAHGGKNEGRKLGGAVIVSVA